MVDEIYILHQESGLPLLHVPFREHEGTAPQQPALVSGGLQGIRLFLQESRIGELTEFITKEHRVKIFNDKSVVVAIFVDQNKIAVEVIENIAESTARLFSERFADQLTNFNGHIAVFESFIPELRELVYAQLQQSSAKEKKEINRTRRRYQPQMGISQYKPNAFTSTMDFSGLVEWIKNRAYTKGEVKERVLIQCPPKGEEVPVDILMDDGLRRMNRLDTWLASRINPGGNRQIYMVIGLNPSQGPANIRQVLERVGNLGDSSFAKREDLFPWYPAELLFIGPSITYGSFDGVESYLKTYRGNMYLISRYASYLHREHFPHHAFYRCRVTGWQWIPGVVCAENVPRLVFPQGNR